jgi:hypothetical protein
MILSFIFFVFLFYLLYKLVFDFVLPIYKTTKQVKKNFREMREQMNGQQPGSTGPMKGQKTWATTEKKPASDYIDFEEVKD